MSFNKFLTILGILSILVVLFLIDRNPVPSEEFNNTCERSFNQQQCWQAIIEGALKDKGLNQAFESLANLYFSQPAFAASCHEYAHILGQAAYGEFSKTGNVELSPRSSYCGYGYYHGFMEALLFGDGIIAQAQDFCAYAGVTLKAENSDAEGACYHGIGHGAVDGSDPRAWGDSQAMIKPGLNLCQKVANDLEQPFGKLYRCVSGAYNALEILAKEEKYKLDLINRDPFSFCATQPKFNLEACYTNMLPALFRTGEIDFEQLARKIEDITEDNNEHVIRSQVMLSLFQEYIRENLNEFDYGISQAVSLCRKLDEYSHLPCIQGLAGGHMKYGEPTKEYVKALDFCGSPILLELEKEICHKYILSALRIWYTNDKIIDICSQVMPKYRRYCNEIKQ